MSPEKIMPSWEEWSELKPEQREYSLFRTLDSIDRKLICDQVETKERILACEHRFKKIENQKFHHKAIAFFGGVVGGVFTVIGKSVIK